MAEASFNTFRCHGGDRSIYLDGGIDEAEGFIMNMLDDIYHSS